jgi:hypothetical protein
MKYLLVCAFFAAGIITCLNTGWAQNQAQVVIPAQNIGEYTGRIQAIDSPRSMILLKVYLDEKETRSAEYNIYVMENAVIESNGRTIRFVDLNAGELVTVQFIINQNGEKEARHIWVKGT